MNVPGMMKFPASAPYCFCFFSTLCSAEAKLRDVTLFALLAFPDNIICEHRKIVCLQSKIGNMFFWG